MEPWSALAAANNAEWCDVMARSHGATTRFDGDAWSGASRTPPLYPDAVTLRPGLSAPDLLARIDASAGCSVKDSFADLDLSDHGFEVLFEAQWIVRPPDATAATSSRWRRVEGRAELTAWEEAWRGDDGPKELFRPSLLDVDSVAVLAASVGDRVVSGAVLNRSASVVGISNLFTVPDAPGGLLAGGLGLAGRLFPALPVVGYESGEALAVARRHGFETVGPLRVWIRPDGL